MAKILVELLHQQKLLCGESPVWNAQSQRLLWTDCGGDCIFSADLISSDIQTYSRGMHASSIALHAQGGLMCSGKDGFFHLDKQGKIRTVYTASQHVPASNINDIIADPLGRVFGGQECFQESKSYNTGFLFRVDTNGEVAIVEEGLHLSNGMGFSPALDRFYLVDTIPRIIYVYDYNAVTGNISNRKAFVTLSSADGLPDGITVDDEGFIWVARWFGYGVSRYDPDGKLERKIELPIAQPTSITFGGKDFNEIFITSAAVQWQSILAPPNHDYTMPRGGSVYRIKQDVQGRSEFLANV